MGFKKDAPVAVAEKPAPAAAPEAPVAAQAVPAETAKAAAPQYSGDEKRVRGQVRMHAIIAGYKVASSLAPTLANTASGIKDELHKLAAEVAAKVEEYSFL